MPSMRSTTVSGPASAKADSRPASAAIGRYRARYASRVVNAASSVLDPRSHPGQSNADAATFLRFGPSSTITRTGSDILDTPRLFPWQHDATGGRRRRQRLRRRGADVSTADTSVTSPAERIDADPSGFPQTP